MKNKIIPILCTGLVMCSLTACGFKIGHEIPISDLIESSENKLETEDTTIENIEESKTEESTQKIEEKVIEIGNDYYGKIYIPGNYTKTDIENIGAAYIDENRGVTISMFRYQYDAETMFDILKETTKSMIIESYGGSEDIFTSSLSELNYDKNGYLIAGVIPLENEDYYLMNFYLLQNDDGTSTYISIEGTYGIFNIEDYRDMIINSYIQPSEKFVENSQQEPINETKDTIKITSILTDKDYIIHIPDDFKPTEDTYEAFVIMTDEEGNVLNVTTSPSTRIQKFLELGTMPESDNGSFIFENIGTFENNMGTFTVVRETSSYDDGASSFNQYYCILDNNEFCINYNRYDSKPVNIDYLEQIVNIICGN